MFPFGYTYTLLKLYNFYSLSTSRPNLSNLIDIPKSTSYSHAFNLNFRVYFLLEQFLGWWIARVFIFTRTSNTVLIIFTPHRYFVVRFKILKRCPKALEFLKIEKISDYSYLKIADLPIFYQMLGTSIFNIFPSESI